MSSFKSMLISLDPLADIASMRPIFFHSLLVKFRPNVFIYSRPTLICFTGQILSFPEKRKKNGINIFILSIETIYRKICTETIVWCQRGSRVSPFVYTGIRKSLCEISKMKTTYHVISVFCWQFTNAVREGIEIGCKNDEALQ